MFAFVFVAVVVCYCCCLLTCCLLALRRFGEHDNFCGRVHGVDDDNKNKGYRLFLMHYFDDPDDGETMWTEELVK